MTTYSITAIITKIDSENKVTISGVGKHRYEKSKDEVYNILEENAEPESSKVLKQDTAFSIVKSGVVKSCAIKTILLAMAMLNKKPLKLTIDDSNNPYSITDIEVP